MTPDDLVPIEPDPLATSALRRQPGDLVKAADWDALLGGVDQIAANTQQDLDAVQAEIAALRAQVAALVLSPATVYAKPGDDLAAKVAAVPDDGGQLALAAGTYTLAETLTVSNRRRLTIVGAGRATTLRCPTAEAALLFDGCTDVDVGQLHVVGGVAPDKPAARHRNGALTFNASTRVVVHDCALTCAPADAPRQRTCLTAVGISAAPLEIRVERCTLEGGALQVGLLLVDPSLAVVRDNRVLLAGVRDDTAFLAQGIVVGGTHVGTVWILENVVDDAVQGIHVGVSGRAQAARRAGLGVRIADGGLPGPPGLPRPGRALPILRLPPRPPAAQSVVLDGNAVRLFLPGAYKRDRHAVFVGSAHSISVTRTTATVTRTPAPAGTSPQPVEGLRVWGHFGGFLVVRDTSLSGFNVGVRVEPMDTPSSATWAVTDTFADGAAPAVHAPAAVTQERNRPEPPSIRPASIVLVPQLARSTGGAQALTATVRDASGAPMPDIAVVYSVAGVTTVADVAAGKTNADGQVQFSFASGFNPQAPPASALDTVTAYVDLNDNLKRDIDEVATAASRVYTPPQPASLTLTPPVAKGTSGPSGSAIALIALVRDGAGNPVKGATVAASVPAGASVAPASALTDAQGRAEFSVRATAPASYTVAATVAANNLNATSSFAFLEPTPALITLSADATTVFAGQQACVTATVADAAGNALSGQPVQVTVSGANKASTPAPVTTDVNGRMRFCYTAASMGSDRVLAWVGTGPPSPLSALAEIDVAEPQVDRVPVPNLLGSTRTQATKLLAASGLRLGTVTTSAVTRVSVVVQQSPAGGRLVATGSAVSITLGPAGEPPIDELAVERRGRIEPG